MLTSIPPAPPALALAASPIQGPAAPMGGSSIPPGPPMGYMPPQQMAVAPPIQASGPTPPGGAEDAMGGPEGAIVGTNITGATPNFLAQMVRSNFDTARLARMEQETVWEKCHDNYRGTAPRPVGEQAMKLRSKVTMKITRTKVAAAVARLKEIGFKWDVKPTPEPNLIDYTPAQMKAQLTEILGSMQNQELAAQIEAEMNVDQMMQQVKDLAVSRADRMKLRIEDDLVEMRHETMYDQGLLDDALYGTMIFKGPLTKERRPGRWIRKNGVWGFLDIDPEVKLYRPEVENVSPWDFYPSPGAWMVEKLDWAIVRNVMGHQEVAELADRPGFDEVEVFAALADKTGAWSAEPWEAKLFAANKQSTSIGVGLPDKFVVLDWWGFIKVSELKRWGGKVAKVPVWSNKDLAWKEGEPNDNDVVIANIWVCGNHVLRAWSTPLKPRRLPFYVVPYERIPKSLWGQGPAWMMEDWQAVMNTVYRAMMDNMAISSMPIGWFDRSRLRADDKGDLTPGKMYEVTDSERLTIPPVQFHFPPNNVAQMRMIAEIARANIQESTSLPDLVQGMTQGASGGLRTASGMSMLGGWADTSTRSVQKNIDQEYTRQVIRALYFWEMQFSNDDSIKGDFDVQALGVDSVMADEVLTQRTIQWGAMMQQNPQAAKAVNWTKYGRLTGKGMGLKDEGLMYSEAEIKQHDDDAAKAQMAMEQAKNNQTQPAMAEKDWLLKAMDRIPENSIALGPMLRKVLTAGGALTSEINAAINAMNHTNADLYAGQLSETDKALLETAQNAAASTNPGGPDPSANPGTGIPSGLPAPGGPVPGLPA